MSCALMLKENVPVCVGVPLRVRELPDPLKLRPVGSVPLVVSVTAPVLPTAVNTWL